MNKQFIASLCLLAMVGMAVGVGVEADDTVTATVTPKLVSVTLSDTTIDYGILALSTDNSNRSMAESATITATNNGNVISDLTIVGSDTTGGTVSWGISSDPAADGTVALDQFAHRFDEGSTFNTGEAAALDGSAYKTLKDDVAGLGVGTVDFVLQMNMPTSSTNTNDTKSTTVTVLATEA